MCLFVILAGFLFSIQTGEAVVNTSPSSIKIPRSTQTANRITYNIRSLDGCTAGVSPRGEFISGGYNLGIINSPLSLSLNLILPDEIGIGSVTETVTVPIAVVRRAEQLGLNRFQYQRVFNMTGCPPSTETGLVQIAVTTEAAADFSITRLQLYFENRRAEVTVKKNQPGLKAFIDIRFTGSGLLKGYWEVDGRIVSYVDRHLVSGGSITVESPEIPALPTIDTGTHLVRFVITNPIHSSLPPEAIYFVAAEEFEKRTIQLISPKDRSEENYLPVTFRWEGREEPTMYLVEFFEEEGQKPIFSAYVKRPFYVLPSRVLKKTFLPGKSYLWGIKGFDPDNKDIGQSSVFQFTFK